MLYLVFQGIWDLKSGESDVTHFQSTGASAFILHYKGEVTSFLWGNTFTTRQLISRKHFLFDTLSQTN